MLQTFFEAAIGRLASGWKGMSIGARVIAVAAMLAVVFAAARSGVLGEEALRFSRMLYAGQVPYFDKLRPSLELELSASISQSGKISELLNGTDCLTGARLEVRVDATGVGWLQIFGMSASGVYPLREEGFGALRTGMTSAFSSEVILDNEEGVEFFAALFTPQKMRPDKWRSLVRDHHEAVQSVDAAKGGAIASAFRSLPDGATSKTLYCLHVPAR